MAYSKKKLENTPPIRLDITPIVANLLGEAYEEGTQYISNSYKRNELYYRNEILEEEKYCGGKVEVRTPAGNIDVLSDDFIYELKWIECWREGLGQLLAYHTYYPKHKPVLGLICGFNEMLEKREVIEATCFRLRVGVRYILDSYRMTLEMLPSPQRKTESEEENPFA